MRKILAAAATLALLGLTGCTTNTNSANTEQRQVKLSEIQPKLCYELKDQLQAKFHKLGRYDKDALGSYGYNYVLYLDLCTDSKAKTTEPDDASGG